MDEAPRAIFEILVAFFTIWGIIVFCEWLDDGKNEYSGSFFGRRKG